MKLLVVSDLHLGARLLGWGEGATARRVLLEGAWEEAIRLVLAAEEGIDALLVAGDLFDEPDPSPEVRSRVLEGLERLAAGGKPAVLLPGIYDGITSSRNLYLRRPWPPGIHPVIWGEPRSIVIPTTDELLEVVTAVPVPGHEPWTRPDLGPRSGRRVGLFHAPAVPGSPLAGWAPPIDPEVFAGWDLDLIVLGGPHRLREEAWGGTPVLSPGSPVPLDPEDEEESFWMFVRLTASGVEVEKRRRDLPSRPARPRSAQAPETEPSEGAPRGGIRGAFADALRERRDRTQSEDERMVLDRALAEGIRVFNRAEAIHVD